MIFRRSVHDAADGQPEEAAVDEQPTGEPTTVLPDEGEPAEAAASEPDPSEPDPDATSVNPIAVDDPDATSVNPLVVEETDGPDGPDGPPAAPAKRKGRRVKRVLLGVGIGVVVLAGAYVGAAYYLGDKVPQETSVAGVDLSGMTAEDAEAALDEQLADVLVDPIPVQMGDVSTTIDPKAAGLELDTAATVASFTGFTLDPGVVFGHLFGLGEREPVVHIDDDALTTTLEAAAGDLDVAPVNGVIELADGAGTVTTEPVDGLSLDVPAAAAAVGDGWLTAQRPLELPSEIVTPDIDGAAVQAAMAEIVDPLTSGPVTVKTNDDSTELTPKQLTASATIEADGSELVLVVDGERLARIVTEAIPSVGETPQDAQIVLEGGEPTIVPAVTGTGLDPEQLAEVVAEAAVATGDDRVAVAELAETEPDFSTADAKELGVEEVVGEFSTPFPYDPTRTENLINGTAHINGTLILPGDVFSLGEALGPITAENGYVSSHVVENGFVTEAMGGGLSQVSTTTFNAAYEAGMEDIQHKPHSRWFDRYPAGREATIFMPTLDMQWGNNTPYGVLVQAWVDADNSRVHVRLWSTKYWDVQITTSDHYGFTAPRTIYNDSPTCTPESGGASGFSIDVNRTISLDGEVNEEYSAGYTWTYSPWNRVVCGSPPSDDDEDADEGASDDG